MNDFDTIYRQYGKRVYCFLLSLTKDELIAEELTQETMFRAIMNIGSFRGECKMSVWLCQIAKNLYFEWQKKNRRIVQLDEENAPGDDGRDLAVEAVDRDMAAKILQQSLFMG